MSDRYIFMSYEHVTSKVVLISTDSD